MASDLRLETLKATWCGEQRLVERGNFTCFDVEMGDGRWVQWELVRRYLGNDRRLMWVSGPVEGRPLHVRRIGSMFTRLLQRDKDGEEAVPMLGQNLGRYMMWDHVLDLALQESFPPSQCEVE
jgi:hypothetical protein